MRIVIDRNRPFVPEADFSKPIVPQLMKWLYGQGVQSLLVEGGAETHRGFLAEDGCWDELRVEISPRTVGGGTAAPQIPASAELCDRKEYDGNIILTYRHV